MKRKEHEFGKAALRVSAAFVPDRAVAKPDFVKGYLFARNWKTGRRLVTAGSAAFEAGVYAGITDNPGAQTAWVAAHRRAAARVPALAERLEAHRAFTTKYAARLDDAAVRGLYVQSGTTVDLVTDGPGTSPDPMGSTPINGPGTPPPMGGLGDPAQPGGASPYQGAPPMPGGPVVPDDVMGKSQQEATPDGPPVTGFSGPGKDYQNTNLAPRGAQRCERARLHQPGRLPGRSLRQRQGGLVQVHRAGKPSAHERGAGMSITDLWVEASFDHEAAAHQVALDGADAGLRSLFPFLAAARSDGEFEHRLALAVDRLAAIAVQHDVSLAELDAMARRRWALLREALNEGVDPLLPVVQDSQASGGPEKPDEHSEGPDFSHGYSEVPQGAPGGPVPNVVTPVPPQQGPVQEATGAAHTACAGCGCGTSKKGKCKGCGKKGSCTCGPDAPCGGKGMQAHASIDPVRRQVLAVTASIQATNPGIGDEEAGRIARRVVGRYLVADLASSVTSDNPAGGGVGGGSTNGGEGTGLAGHMLEGQGIRSMLPGTGGDAAGAGAGLAEDAMMAAL